MLLEFKGKLTFTIEQVPDPMGGPTDFAKVHLAQHINQQGETTVTAPTLEQALGNIMHSVLTQGLREATP